MKLRPIHATSVVPALRWWPLCLSLCAGASMAAADSPFQASVSETISHDNNILRAPTNQVSDWVSSTGVRASLDNNFGRDTLKLGLLAGYDRHKTQTNLDNFNYLASAALDWSLPGNVSGGIGADSSRQLYQYGLQGDVPFAGRSIQTVNHVYAKGQVGGLGLVTLLGGVDATDRKNSSTQLLANSQRVVVLNGGLRYKPSADLSFTTGGTFSRGRYPNYDPTRGADEFNVRTLSETVSWQATGLSSFSATAGFTSEHHTLRENKSYLSGSVSWNYQVREGSKFNLNVHRGSDGGTTVTAYGEPQGAGNVSLNTRALNTGVDASWSQALTGKISGFIGGQILQRDYGAVLVSNAFVPGHDQTRQISTGLTYQVTRTIGLDCRISREVRRAGASIASVIPAYDDNNISCSGSLALR